MKETSIELSVKEELHDIRRDIKELRHEITKYKGFVGGVLWALGALSIALQFVVSWFKGGAM